MTTLLDANVLIALVFDDHVHHSSAEAWISSTEDRFATCPVTEGSLVRMLIRNGHPADAAHVALAALADEDRYEFWADELSYREVPLDGLIGHRQVTDAYLAQLARAQGGKLATFDQGLAKLHRDIAELVPISAPVPRKA